MKHWLASLATVVALAGCAGKTSAPAPTPSPSDRATSLHIAGAIKRIDDILDPKK